MTEYGWKEYRLGDIAELFDGPHATPKKTLSGPVFLGISSLNRGTIDESQFEYISESDYELWTKRIAPKEHDIVFSYETKLGEAAIIPKGFRCCLGRRLGLLRVNDKLIDPHFLLYYYLSPIFQAVIHERTIHGTTVDRIPLLDMPKFPLILPPLPEQRAIASVLSSLDDKIDLLHRQNKTLESMAETLFRQWFIEEADEGWEDGKLDSIMILSNGKARPNTEGLIPVYGGNGVLVYTDQFNYDGESIIIGRVGAYCGSLYFEENKIWVSDNALHAKARDPMENYYLFYLLKNLELNSFAEGSSHPLLTQTLLRSIDILLPLKEKRQKFSSVAKLIHSKIIQNRKSIRTLESLRDTLLPKLMSGEVRVQL